MLNMVEDSYKNIILYITVDKGILRNHSFSQYT